MTKEFYLDVNKSTPKWSYSLRLRNYQEEVGVQVATFNPHTCLQNPGVMEKIVTVLNRELNEPETDR